MELYLSSYKFGSETQKLKEMVGANKKAALISNALDFSTDIERTEASTASELSGLKELGFEPEELDLRDYFGKPEELKEKMKQYGLVWVRGGNTFVLRRAMKQSGFDEIITEMVKKNEIVYAGYSAGVCVITPTLEGTELIDDPCIVPEGYEPEVIWEGLGLVDFRVAPHYRSDHPESAVVEKAVEFYEKKKVSYKALRDGEVIVIH